MKKNNLRAKARCLLLAGTVCAGFAACDDDDNEARSDNDMPGILTATSSDILESYTMKGAVLLPVSAEICPQANTPCCSTSRRCRPTRTTSCM